MPCSAAPQSTVLNVCDEFLERIRNHTDVKEGFEDFNQRIRQEFDVLMQNIQKTHPRFVLDLKRMSSLYRSFHRGMKKKIKMKMLSKDPSNKAHTV